MTKVAIIGTVGLPAKYGGFETLAENLVLYNDRIGSPYDLDVYCETKSYPDRPSSFGGAHLRYLPLKANGKQAMFYDMLSLVDASFRGTDVVILLGHGGSFAIPFLKVFTKTKFIVNIDGIEWRRQKWSGLARWIIRKSEAIAVAHSHEVIADNEAIRDYVAGEFGACCEVIAYGGDHALLVNPDPSAVSELPERYALALCRIEPENNVALILDAFASLDTPLVFVGNWENSDYGRSLKKLYAKRSNILILDPIYEPSALRAIRDRADIYVHGHSAGGTNPSLVEMMHFGIPVFAHDCVFNRQSTHGRARYFDTSEDLAVLVQSLNSQEAVTIGQAMQEIAHRHYTWDRIGKAYFDVLERV